MSERDDGWLPFFLIAIMFVCLMDSQTRDLQRRVGQLEEQVRQ